MSHNLDMNAGRESDGCVVPAKCPNKGGCLSPAEGMEGSQPTKENTGQTTASQIQSWGNALERLLAKLKQVKATLRVRMHQPRNVVGIGSWFFICEGNGLAQEWLEATSVARMPKRGGGLLEHPQEP
jgi:hypothetical protein